MAREFDTSVEEVGRSISALIQGSRLMPDVADIWRAIGERCARARLYSEKEHSKRTEVSPNDPVALLARANALVVDTVMRMGLDWQRIVSRRLPAIRRRLDEYRSDTDPLPEVRNGLLDEVALLLTELAEFAADEGRALQQDIELFQRRLIPEEPQPSAREKPVRRRTKIFVSEGKYGGISWPGDLADALRLTKEKERLSTAIKTWCRLADPHIHDMLYHQFDADAKYFRPLTVFSCHRAVSAERIPDSLITSAQVVEMMHNVSLIIDDLVDKSEERRGKQTMHVKYDELTAYMVAGYIVGDCYDLLARQLIDECHDLGPRPPAADGGSPRASRDLAAAPDPSESQFRRRYDETRPPSGPPGETDRNLDWVGPVRFDMRLFSELLRRLAVAECIQWDSRKDGKEAKQRRWERLSLADWYWLAREDTGSMFEICACLGARSQRFRKFGRLLGMLYHGCDDVVDMLQPRATGEAVRSLGGGGNEDLDEGILTLPAALAIRDDQVRRLYREGDRNDPKVRDVLLAAYRAQKENALRELDKLEQAAKQEAEAVSSAADGLIILVEYTRALAPRSNRR